MSATFEQDTTNKILRLEQKVEQLGILDSPIDLISPFLALPGLVGFWPMSSVQRSTGNAYDLSGQGRTLTYNGNPTYNIYNNLVPYIDLDGTGDYLSRTDETDLDILGTETIYNSAVRGLTLGGWFWFDSLTVSSNRHIIGKGIPGVDANPSYSMWVWTGSTTSINFWAIGASTGSTGIICPTGQWVFCVSRWIPSTSVKMWANSSTATSTSTIPASLNNSAYTFYIMDQIDGRASLCFLCANALSDTRISVLFEQTRGAFDV